MPEGLLRPGGAMCTGEKRTVAGQCEVFSRFTPEKVVFYWTMYENV
jgi:hypothetical protein